MIVFADNLKYVLNHKYGIKINVCVLMILANKLIVLITKHGILISVDVNVLNNNNATKVMNGIKNYVIV